MNPFHCLPLLLLLLVGCKKESQPSVEPPAPVVTPDTFQLTPFSLQDSTLLHPDQTDGPGAYYNITVALANTPSEAFNQLVNDSLLSIFTDETTGASDYPAAYREITQKAFAAFRDDLAEDSELDVNFDFSILAEPLLNKAGILTLDAMQYSYQGGAHGNGYSTYASFTDQPARYLGFDQIFIDEADSLRVGVLLTEYIEEERKEFLFDPEAQIPLTKNVGLLKEGVAFHYPQYEIAPYAAGPIEIVLPYDILIYRKLLRPDVEELVRQLLE